VPPFSFWQEDIPAQHVVYDPSKFPPVVSSVPNVPMGICNVPAIETPAANVLVAVVEVATNEPASSSEPVLRVVIAPELVK